MLEGWKELEDAEESAAEAVAAADDSRHCHWEFQKSYIVSRFAYSFSVGSYLHK